MLMDAQWQDVIGKNSHSITQPKLGVRHGSLWFQANLEISVQMLSFMGAN